MGTRADFYIGRNPATMKWLGSIAMDGYPSGIPERILSAKTEQQFLHLVRRFVKSRSDGTLPEQGWPWPWDDSSLTDFVYAFEDGIVWVAHFGEGWVDAELALIADKGTDPSPLGIETVVWPEKLSFPNCRSSIKKELGDERSGLLIL